MMTVRQLMKELSNMDPGKEVRVEKLGLSFDDQDESRGGLKEVEEFDGAVCLWAEIDSLPIFNGTED